MVCYLQNIMGQALCDIDQQKLGQEPKQLISYSRPQHRVEQAPPISQIHLIPQDKQPIINTNHGNAPTIIDVFAIQRESSIKTQHAYISNHSDSHPQPTIVIHDVIQNKPKQTFAVPCKQQIVLTEPIKQRLQSLGNYTYPNDQTFPRGTMINEVYKLSNVESNTFIIQQGNIHGKGKFVLQDGSLLETYVVENEVTGVGRLINPNGDYFQGEFKQNKAQSQGLYKQGNIIYEGSFLNNMPHGEGTEKGQGFTYSGTFQYGKKKLGKLWWKDQNGQYEYEGHFENNQLNGFGQLIDNGKIIKGEFVRGKMVAPIF